MKKITLLLTIVLGAFAAHAQLSLTGTSYTQNFDGIGTAIPTGWFLYTAATSTSLGTADVTYGSGSTSFGAYWDTTDCPSDVFGHGFKNCASADNAHMSTATCIAQEAETNRALGVRQASNTSYPGFDPGPSFALELANTIGDSAFTLTFKLQNLDSSCPRVVTWTLDYGLGTAPTTFTPVTTTPATLTTGGSTFTNQTVTAALPAAINKQAAPVWIRISTLAATTGSGDRPTSAIDDYSLSWVKTGTSAVSNVSAAQTLSLTVIGKATPDNITLAYGVETEGLYSLYIYDLAGRILFTEAVNALAGNQTATVSGLHLAPGMYFAKMSNGNSSSVARVAVN